MRIRELTFTNFRGFGGERKFQLADRFTVIAGINGRGKTTVLDGVALLVAKLFRSLSLSAGNQRTISANDVHSGAQDASLAMKANCAGIPLQFAVTFRAETETVRATRLAAAVKREIVANYGDPKRTDDQSPIAVYFTTDRAGLRLPKSLPTDIPIGQQLAHHGALSNRIVDYRDFMARYRTWTAMARGAELIAFNRALSILLDDFGDVSVDDEPPRLTVRKGQTRLSLKQLSDGERAFIAVIGDLVRRLALANPDLADPLNGSGVVLIDELELHLHPMWQREIVEKLRHTFPNIQFIATTHSPFIIQSLRSGELVNLDPEEGEYSNRSVEDIAETVMGVELPQKSKRHLDMIAAAERYFRMLRDEHPITSREVAGLRARLDELSAPFSDDPAYIALLNVEREQRLGGETS